MLLKRIYHQDKLERDKSGAVVNILPGAVKGVVVKRADHGVQRFSPNLIDGGIAEGWISMGQGRLTITNLGGDDIVYKIIRTPGYFCCHCDAAIPDGGQVVDKVTRGMMHVAEKHAGARSPDVNNPAGYRREDFYTAFNEAGATNTCTHEEAAALERGIRAAINEKLSAKYGARRQG